MPEFAEATQLSGTRACYDCGKCTASCPLARVGSPLSPRRQILAANRGARDAIQEDAAMFACLTCGLCNRRCPAQVDYMTLVRSLRELTHGEGIEPSCPHGDALQSMMRMMARGGTRQNRMGWLGEPLQAQPTTGKVFFWTGCAMYYDTFFAELGLSALRGVKAAIRLMNALGVTPVVSPEERCCGHDLLWNGDREHFDMLAQHNVKLVHDSGATLLVTNCAECLRTWKKDYLPYFDAAPPRMLHVTEYLVEHLGDLSFKRNGSRRVTFQDPCRLGRHLSIYDPPRQLLAALPGVELAEMRHCGPAATCCAGGSWSHCDRFAKRVQIDRLQEAKATGAELLTTACPKCQIHLRCAMRDPHLRDTVEIKTCDVVELAADVLDDDAITCEQSSTQ